jgi:hypothetical protein
MPCARGLRQPLASNTPEIRPSLLLRISARILHYEVYHITNAEAGELILAKGFRDSTGTYMTPNEHTGVWVSDRPCFLTGPYDVDSAACIELTIEDSLIAFYEWRQDWLRYREWLVPAELLNTRASMRKLPVDEAYELEWG